MCFCLKGNHNTSEKWVEILKITMSKVGLNRICQLANDRAEKMCLFSSSSEINSKAFSCLVNQTLVVGVTLLKIDKLFREFFYFDINFSLIS